MDEAHRGMLPDFMTKRHHRNAIYSADHSVTVMAYVSLKKSNTVLWRIQ